MKKQAFGGYKIIWLAVLFLFVGGAATTFAFMHVMTGYLPDDSGAISLIPPEFLEGGGSSAPAVSESVSDILLDDFSEQTEVESSADDSSDAVSETPSQETPLPAPEGEQSRQEQAPVTPPQRNPGFAVEDGKGVWSTDTQVEIFRVSYVNGQHVVTVQSADGDKVIAPGTENSYTFKLKNTGDVALDYTVEIDATFTPGDITIPIVARISRYDGKWVLGDEGAFDSVSALDAAEDADSLKAGNYTYYTLEWSWPFESGDDRLDTLLGNLAGEQDLVFTISIITTATESEDPDGGGGMEPPPTGDDFNPIMWIAIAVASFILLIVLVRQHKKARQSY